MDSAPIVVLSQVSRRFGGRPALTELDLEVQPGMIAVLLGPNGAGKTTAIRIVTGALPVTSGTVRVFGLDPIADGEQVRRRCGVVSAKPALYDRLTGRENLEFSAELYGLDRRTAPIDAAAERFGILPALTDLVGGYSTGMKTRLALARAVLHDPDLLLLDEPTSGLDPESSVAVLDLVKAFARAGKTVVLCTHLLLEAEGLADRIVVMHEGRSIEAGEPDVLMAKYWPEPELTVRVGPVTDLRAFDDLPGVRSVELMESARTIVASGGAGHAPTAPGREIRFVLTAGDRIPYVVHELCRRQVPILGVTRHRPSLEDLYFASRGVARGEMSEVRREQKPAPVKKGRAA